MARLYEWIIIEPTGNRVIIWAYTRNAAIRKHSLASGMPENVIREKCKIVRHGIV